jgi:phage host-nuclease inhibitor protein Gam
MNGAIKCLGDFENSLLIRKHAEIDLDEQRVAMEQELALVTASYSKRLTDLALKIKAQTARQMEYLEEHKADFDGPPRSIELPSGTIGYRLGQPRLAPISKWTWDKVLNHMLERGINNFIRRTPEVDREQLLAQKDDFGADGLKAIGLRVVQDDKPFVDVKREDTAAVKQAAGGEAA